MKKLKWRMGQRWPTEVKLAALGLYRAGRSCRKVAELLAERYDPAPSRQSVHAWVKADAKVRTNLAAQRMRRKNERNGGRRIPR